jgi:hypothetical protein
MDNLFDNDMVSSAKSSLDDKVKEDYKNKGLKMYGNIDFETSKVDESMDLRYLQYKRTCSFLLHGLDISDLDPQELEIYNFFSKNDL